MERKITATEARAHFSELMQSIKKDQNPVIVEKSGKAQVVILSIEHYQRLNESKNQDWLRQLEQAHALIEKELKGKTLPNPSELIEKMRTERTA